MTKRTLLFIAFIFLLLAAFYFAKRLKQNEIPQLNLSNFVLKDLDSQPVNLASFSGKPLVVNIWGTWCGPCLRELPGFKAVKEKYGSKVNFVFVSDESLDKLIAFRDAKNYGFLYVQSLKPLDELGIKSVPATYFYDENGAFINARMDSMSETELEAVVAGMIK